MPKKRSYKVAGPEDSKQMVTTHGFLLIFKIQCVALDWRRHVKQENRSWIKHQEFVVSPW